MVQHPNPAGLKEALADGIRKFEQQARAEGLPNEQVIAARYILCTLLDESAASTPWGGSGVWSGQSLLVLFHNETWGGEKVFQLMSKLAENVPANRNLLELMYVALAFGFEGRYRVLNDGKAQLESLRARLSQMLRGGRAADGDKTLSPRWEGVPAQVARLRDGLPMWVVASLAGLVLLGVYLGLTYSLNSASDNVFTTLQGLDAKAPAMTAPPPPPPPAAAPRLATFLKGEIEQGLVQVRDLADRSIVVIKGDGFFEPGSSVIADRTLPLLARIAEGAEGDAGHRADHRPHRQPADPHPALPVELAPVAGPRQRRQDLARRVGHQARAHARRRQGRCRAGRSEPDACRPGQEPARRDHPHHSRERSMNTAVNVNTGVNVPATGVGKFFRFLLHPLFLALLGVIAISALVWYVGPLISIGETRPLDPTWIRVAVIAVLFGLLILRAVWRLWSQRRANAALVQGMTKGPSSADKEIATLNQRFSEALDVLKKTPGKGKGALLYQLPWYIFIGAPGSGKTTALMNAGLTFPLAEKMGGASVRGVGGTRNCDWWFTDEAVLIDTAGRYTTQESNSAVDASAWDGFLALLRKSRPRRPINGVLLTVNIQDLLQQTPVERKDHAAKLRARIQELQEKLGVRPPVYVLVTKADLIAGFNESFGALSKEEREPGLGLQLPVRADQHRRPARQLRLRVRRPREAPARPRRAADGRRARGPEARRHLQLPAAVRRHSRPARRLPRAGVQRRRHDRGTAAPARRLLHQRHPGRHADRPGARHAVAHLRHRAPAAAAGRGPRQELLPAPAAEARGLQRAGARRREPGDGDAPGPPARARLRRRAGAQHRPARRLGRELQPQQELHRRQSRPSSPS